MSEKTQSGDVGGTKKQDSGICCVSCTHRSSMRNSENISDLIRPLQDMEIIIARKKCNFVVNSAFYRRLYTCIAYGN